MEKIQTDKIEAVRSYERNAPVKLKAYVAKILGYECCVNWTFEQLADEFGLGYIMYMEEERAKIRERMI